MIPSLREAELALQGAQVALSCVGGEVTAVGTALSQHCCSVIHIAWLLQKEARNEQVSANPGGYCSPGRLKHKMLSGNLPPPPCLAVIIPCSFR